MKSGVLLLNMGGPNNLKEVELFLRNMFADRYILPMNPLMRKLIGSIIVKKRKDEAKENYKELGGKSPLNDITASLCKKIEDRLNIPIKMAMRYVPPFATEALQEFKNMGIDNIILFPMYPHYSTTTTKSSVEDVLNSMRELDYSANINIVDPYYDDYNYIQIQIDRIIEATKDINRDKYTLLLSAHGLPVKIIKSGDPYQIQIEANVSAIKTALKCRGIEFRDIKLVYQSRVGSGKWLEPNLVDVLRSPDNLRVVIVPLSFTIDNSETLFELDIEHKLIATKIGYDDYRVVKCPNDKDDFVEFAGDKIKSFL